MSLGKFHDLASMSRQRTFQHIRSAFISMEPQVADIVFTFYP